MISNGDVPSFDEWQASTAKPVDLAQMDALVKEMQARRQAYEAQKTITSGFYEEYEKAESKVLAALKAVGKTKYSVEGVGTVYVSGKPVVRVPKSSTEKNLLFDYIGKAHGKDVLLNLLSINHQTLQTFYKQEMERAAERGEAIVNVPGVEAPTMVETLNFRKG